MVTARGILRGTFRLSIVVALLIGGYTAVQDWRASVTEYQDEQKILRTLECGARAPPERLQRALNENGLIDLSKVGCSFDEKFFASFEELAKARDGTIRHQTWSSEGPSLNYAKVIVSAIIAFVVVNLLGLVSVAALWVFRWVAAGFRSRS